MGKKYEILKAMHLLVQSINDEDAYMDWIMLIPDEPSDDDLMDIAQSDEDMQEVYKLFVRIIRRYCFDKDTTCVVNGKVYL